MSVSPETVDVYDAPSSAVVECEECGASMHVPMPIASTVCPYCSHPTIVERPATADEPDPLFVLGFAVDKEKAHEHAMQWTRSRRFARTSFKRAPVESVRSVYLPAYLYSATADSNYAAEIGEEYTETETTTDSSGKRTTRTRTRTEWRSLRGSCTQYTRDIVVTASRAIANDELEAVEPFDLRALVRYDPRMILGWIAEEPSMSPDHCRQLSHDEANAAVMARLARFMPGDKHRNLQAQISLRDEALDLLLLPLWVFAVKYHPKKDLVRVLVNGQTGACGGSVPLSPLKIAATILVALLILGGVVWWGVQK